MILYFVGFGMTFYNVLFPGPEKWGWLALPILGIPCLVLLLADLIMRAMITEPKHNWIVQFIITILLVLWLNSFMGFWW